MVFARLNLTLDVGPLVATPERAREYLVASGAPSEDLDPYLDRLEGASYRAYLDMLLNRPSLRRLAVPSLVVGAVRTPSSPRRSGGTLQMPSAPTWRFSKGWDTSRCGRVGVGP